VSGPFQRTRGELDTDLVATVSAGSSSAHLALDKVGKDTYVELAGTFYKLPAKITAGATGATGAPARAVCSAGSASTRRRG